MKELTDRQKEVLEAIKAFTMKNHFPPTVRELCSILGISSPRGVAKHLEALEKKGYIKRTSGHRSIVIPLELPLMGKVTAGLKTIATEEMDGYLALEDVFSGPNQFGLRVKGDSMEGAGILEGDIVVVNSNLDWLNGDIVVAIVDDMATVKRIKKDDQGSWWLEPSNPRYNPIPLTENVKIVGKVVAVIRKY
jgi:repressor LexA